VRLFDFELEGGFIILDTILLSFLLDVVEPFAYITQSDTDRSSCETCHSIHNDRQRYFPLLAARPDGRRHWWHKRHWPGYGHCSCRGWCRYCADPGMHALSTTCNSSIVPKLTGNRETSPTQQRVMKSSTALAGKRRFTLQSYPTERQSRASFQH